MATLRERLSRLLPERLRPRPVLTPPQRMELWTTVPDGDPCLRAMTDRMMETLEGEFLVAIDPRRSNEERLRALEGVRVSYWNLKSIEDERDQAKAWRVEREQQKGAP